MLAAGLRRLSRLRPSSNPSPFLVLPFNSFASSTPPSHSRSFRDTPSLGCLNLVSFKRFSSRAFDHDTDGFKDDPLKPNGLSRAEDGPTIESDASDISIAASDIVAQGSGWYSPINFVIGLLDAAQEFSGLPWWVVISTSTLALRIVLLPITVLQLRKVEKIVELARKLPPPLPPPSSGRGFMEQYMLFRDQKRLLGCPSHLWSFASFFAQVPCFLLWMMSIRRMSVDNHHGFDSGGALWFQNLTEYPHGALGPVFPLLIAGLHFFNIQIAFNKFNNAKLPGILGLLQKYYKLWLDFLTIPIFFTGFWVPQGSLVYWLTNSSLTAVQQLSFKHPYIRKALRLHEGSGAVNSVEMPINSISPDELLAIALQHRAAGNQDAAVPFLKLAMERDPDMVKAFIAMGEILLSKNLLTEATEYFNHAISKIRSEESKEGLLISAHLGAGVSLFLQGNNSEGLAHLKRIPKFKEPKDPWEKVCYFKGLVTLASALSQEGEKAEAITYLQMAAVYDPSVNNYIKELQTEEQ